MNMPSLDDLSTLVRDIAQHQLLPYFGHVSRQYKDDRSVVTEADLAMQNALQQGLKKLAPEYDMLAEEMTAEQQQELLAATDTGLWIVDPLDGTSNFAAGIPYFSVSVAFYMNGAIQLGVVYDPVRDEMFSAAKDQGSWLNGKPLPRTESPASLSKCIATIDFKRLTTDMASRLALTPPYGSQRSFGSVALDWCWLACNRFQIYLHGRMNIWDYAAGELVFRETGGRSTALDGLPVFKAGVQTRSAVAALEHRLFEEWSAFLELPEEINHPA